MLDVVRIVSLMGASATVFAAPTALRVKIVERASTNNSLGCCGNGGEHRHNKTSQNGGGGVTLGAQVNDTSRRELAWDDPAQYHWSTEKCDAMLRDNAGLMQQMWHAEPWKRRTATDNEGCWDRHREFNTDWMDRDWYFDAAIKGLACHENWFEGNDEIDGLPNIGEAGEPPRFPRDAPALFGFDEDIEEFCANEKGTPWDLPGGGMLHGRKCVEASQNILSLYGKRIPYNLCRNLEWQICAAKGMLPGQGGFGIRFATAPKRLHTRGNKPFGQCGGWTPTGECNGGYATDDIYFLEICLLNQLCTNNHELFDLEVGQFFVCQLDEARFWELKEILLTPPTSGDERCPANYHYCPGNERHGDKAYCDADPDCWGDLECCGEFCLGNKACIQGRGCCVKPLLPEYQSTQAPTASPTQVPTGAPTQAPTPAHTHTTTTPVLAATPTSPPPIKSTQATSTSASASEPQTNTTAPAPPYRHIPKPWHHKFTEG